MEFDTWRLKERSASRLVFPAANFRLTQRLGTMSRYSLHATASAVNHGTKLSLLGSQGAQLLELTK